MIRAWWNDRWYRLYLAVLFYLSTVFLHVEVGALLNGIFGQLGRQRYNQLITSLVVLVGVYLIYKLIRRHRVRHIPSLIFFLVAYTTLAVAISFALLFVIHIEAIHFLQYAILAFILRTVLPSYGAVMILATLAGAYDELVQYLILDTRADYFDFNDVFLDAVGAGMGLLVAWFIGVGTKVRERKVWWRRPEWMLVLFTTLWMVVLALLGEFSINLKVDDPAFFTLYKGLPEGFWHYPAGPYARFHILTPVTGLIMIVMTIYMYGLLDKVGVER